jgi:hypothetical protein
MKKNIILLLLVLLSNVVQSQIKTKVFTLDLNVPTEKALFGSDTVNTRLVLPSKSPLAFNLINGNPYKYKYVINHKLINLFEGQGYNPFDSIAGIPKKDSTFQSTNKGLEIAFGYVSKAQNAINIINQNQLIANNLLIGVQKVTTEDDDIINILNAAIILKVKATNLNSNIQSYIAEITSEDSLDLSTFLQKRTSFNKHYIELISMLNDLNQNAVLFPKIKDDYSKSLEEIDQNSNKIKLEISKMYSIKKNNYLLPVDVNGKNIDIVEVTVERYDKTATNPTPDKYVYNIWIKGGLKIDISGGVFISSLFDKEYETKDNVVNVNGISETQKLIYEKNIGNYDYGFGSTINVSLRGGSWIRPTLNFGALFTTNQKFQILTGIGLILGKEERIIINGGLAMGSINTISDNYKSDGSTSYNLGTSGVVPTTNKFSFGHFFGITYNFGKTNKQDLK